MEIQPVYVFYGDDHGRIQIDVDFFRNYFLQQGCFVDTFDGTKAELSEILMSAEANPLFGDKRLIIVDHAPWFGSDKKAKNQEESEFPSAEDEPSGKKGAVKKDTVTSELLTYLENPNEDICIVFLAKSVDKRKKITKAAEKCGKVREYKQLKTWELPEFVRKCSRKEGKNIDGRAITLLIDMVGEDTSLLSSEMQKLSLYVAERKNIGENDVLRVASRSAEANSFQLSDAINSGSFISVVKVLDELLAEMKPGEYMVIHGYIANYLRMLMRVKELDAEGMGIDDMAKTLGIHVYRIKQGLSGARRFTMAELAAGLTALSEVDLALKSGSGEFKASFRSAILSFVKQ